jgi:hypothetical protein
MQADAFSNGLQGKVTAKSYDFQADAMKKGFCRGKAHKNGPIRFCRGCAKRQPPASSTPEEILGLLAPQARLCLLQQVCSLREFHSAQKKDLATAPKMLVYTK